MVRLLQLLWGSLEELQIFAFPIAHLIENRGPFPEKICLLDRQPDLARSSGVLDQLFRQIIMLFLRRRGKIGINGSRGNRATVFIEPHFILDWVSLLARIDAQLILLLSLLTLEVGLAAQSPHYKLLVSLLALLLVSFDDKVLDRRAWLQNETIILRSMLLVLLICGTLAPEDLLLSFISRLYTA